MLTRLIDDFERVLAEGPNPKKKDLLRRLVKKVLVHSRRTIEIWYALPTPARFEDWHKWLPTMDVFRTHGDDSRPGAQGDIRGLLRNRCARPPVQECRDSHTRRCAWRLL